MLERTYTIDERIRKITEEMSLRKTTYELQKIFKTIFAVCMLLSATLILVGVLGKNMKKSE